MLLTADIGNTNITLGIFDKDNFVKEFRTKTCIDFDENVLKNISTQYKIEGCVIGSVVDEIDEKFTNAVKNIFKLEPVIVSTKINTEISFKVDTPDEMGADRIANAVAAYKLYKTPVIVVDFGTATTFDVVNSKGESLGGMIAPGINLQLQVLEQFTSKLPKIEAAVSPKAIATNTVDAILAGVIRGTSCMIEGLIHQSEQELGEKAKIVATGGYSSLVGTYMLKPFDEINPILTLQGLKFLYEMNK